MVALLIDTATERGVVAVLDREHLLYACELPIGLQNSVTLMPVIEQAMREVGLQMEDLSLLIAGVGPGSYTGIRVGAIVAKTLSFALGKPLVGISTLYGLIPLEDGQFAALIDAKIGGIYVLFGEKQGSSVVYTSEPQMASLPEIAHLFHSVSFLISPQTKALQPIIHTRGAWLERAPDVRQIGQLAFRKLEKGEFSTDSSLEILYLRKTQAEIERDQKQKIL